MTNSTLSHDLKLIYSKLLEIEKTYNFNLPTSIEFDYARKFYNNANSPQDENLIKKMYFDLYSYAIKVKHFSNRPKIVDNKTFNEIKPNKKWHF